MYVIYLYNFDYEPTFNVVAVARTSRESSDKVTILKELPDYKTSQLFWEKIEFDEYFVSIGEWLSIRKFPEGKF